MIVKNCKLDGPMIFNTTAWQPDITFSDCDIGDIYAPPLDAVEAIQGCRIIFERTTFRFTGAALELGNSVQEWRDEDCDYLIIRECKFEARGTGTGRVLRVNEVAHLANTGFIHYDPKNVRVNTNSDWAGLTCTFNNTTDIVTINGHSLNHGDEIYFSITSTGMTDALPPGLSTSTPYYVRVIDDNTVKLYDSKINATSNDDATGFVSIDTNNGVGTFKATNPKNGCVYTFSVVRDVALKQKYGNGKEFFAYAEPTNSTLAFTAGDLIYNAAPAKAGVTKGWICIKSGVRGTDPGDFISMGTY